MQKVFRTRRGPHIQAEERFPFAKEGIMRALKVNEDELRALLVRKMVNDAENTVAQPPRPPNILLKAEQVQRTNAHRADVEAWENRRQLRRQLIRNSSNITPITPILLK